MTADEIKNLRKACEDADGQLVTIDPRTMIALLDEVEAFAGYDKELAAVGERTGRLVAAFEAERDALHAERDEVAAALVGYGDTALPPARLAHCAAIAVSSHRYMIEQCDALRAEIERLRPVFEAAKAWRSIVAWEDLTELAAAVDLALAKVTRAL